MIENVLVVLNYNDYNTIEKFLNNAIHIESIDKLIVVDNCSTDNSFEKLCAFESEKTDVIKTEKNGGYAYGNNFGVKYAMDKYSPKYVFISNPDVEFDTEVINAILTFFESQEQKNIKTGVVTGNMVTTTQAKICPAWKLPAYSDCLWENLIILRKLLGIKGVYYDRNYFQQNESRVDVVSGAFFAVKAEAFLEVGMFDEGTFLYGEENILAFKLKSKGYTSYVLNNHNFLHHHSVSISKSIKSTGKRLDLAYESRCLYLDKYLKAGKIKKVVHAVTYKMGRMNYLFARKIISENDL